MLSDDRLRVYLDANVLLSGVATDNPHSASRVVLVASELTLLDLLACQRVVEECHRNLEHFVEDPNQLRALKGTLHAVIDRSVEVVETPPPEKQQIVEKTDSKDVVHLASAVEHDCHFLVTLNLKDFPKHHDGVTVMEPGILVRRIRERIKGLA